MSIEQIVAEIRATPYPMPEHERREWVEGIEADDVPITADIANSYFGLIGVLELTPEQQLPPANEATA